VVGYWTRVASGERVGIGIVGKRGGFVRMSSWNEYMADGEGKGRGGT
jgi:hypothetical protein